MEPLFETTTHYTYSEMRRYDSFVLNRITYFYLRLVIVMLLLVACGVIVMCLGYQLVGITIMIGSVLGVALRITVTATAAPKRISNSPMLNKTANLRFYADHMTKDNDKNHTEFDYSQIYRLRETERNFYIIIKGVGGIIIVKDNCSDELVAFLREHKM